MSATLASTASARAPDRARFKVTVTGSDQVTWSYRESGRPSCGGQDRVGNGSQAIRYSTARPVTISARSAAGGMPKLAPGPLDGARFAVAATITRQSSVTGCPSDDVDVQDPPDCGTKRFSILGNLRYLSRGRLGFFSMAASRVSNVFRNCPNFIGAVGRDDTLGVGLRRAVARLSERKLLHGRERRFVARGSGSEPSRTAVFQSRWKATFRRLR